jgi:hypothetical protein
MFAAEGLLRVFEESTILIPVGLYFLWRYTLGRGEAPSRRAVALIAAGVAVLGLMLFWLGTHEDQGRPGARYIPAQLRHGEVVPGRSP